MSLRSSGPQIADGLFGAIGITSSIEARKGPMNTFLNTKRGSSRVSRIVLVVAILAAYGFDSAAAHETASGTLPQARTQIAVTPIAYCGDEKPSDGGARLPRRLIAGASYWDSLSLAQISSYCPSSRAVAQVTPSSFRVLPRAVVSSMASGCEQSTAYRNGGSLLASASTDDSFALHDGSRLTGAVSTFDGLTRWVNMEVSEEERNLVKSRVRIPLRGTSKFVHRVC